uniref:Uncharacterized protein n=1 Tax=Vibrio sp. 09022 TaxID=452804 RepID=A9M538_9VIBR|nr:hypothetical protein [Vibrio sp. 09022]ABX77149.1 hypothetical protein BMSF_0011 [Vibrio sp. 09022]
MALNLIKLLTWHEANKQIVGQKVPDTGERVLVYLPDINWFTMATFVRDKHGECFALHCVMEGNRPIMAKIVDIGEVEIHWASLTPEVAKADVSALSDS